MIRKVFVLLFCAIAAQAAYVPQDDYKMISDGIQTLITNGTVSRELEQFVDKYNVRELFNPKSKQKGIVEDVVCFGCAVFAEAVLFARRAGLSHEFLLNVVTIGCQVLQIHLPHVCEGTIHLQFGLILKMIDATEEMDGMQACAIFWQDKGCSNPNARDWSIDIHEGHTVEKREKSHESMKILHITDVHFDPIYEPGTLANCKAPVCCQYDSGVVTRPEDAAGYWTDYYACDFPDYTLIDSFQQMIEQHPDVDYIYFTGDIITHRVWATDIYNNSIDMVRVLNMFEDAFPGIPIYPVVGNHEPHPLNIWAETGDETISAQWVFDLVAEHWGRWLPKDTQETILKGGYYTALVREGLRVIGLNSNVAYIANWWLIHDDVDSYNQLQWLESVLYEAEKNHESVHILSHVPTGDDTSYILWAREFRRIVRRYSNTITAIFNGHSHQDEFILYFDEDDDTKAINVAYNGGSLVTFTDNNPDYKVFEIDTGSFDVLNFEEWIFNVTEANLTPEKSPRWYKLYSFLEDYGLKSAEPQEIFDLTVRMAEEEDNSLIKQFYRYKWRDGPELKKECDEDCLKFNLCTLVRSVFRDTTQCDILMEKWR